MSEDPVFDYVYRCTRRMRHRFGKRCRILSVGQKMVTVEFQSDRFRTVIEAGCVRKAQKGE